jgi:hypothetical protein
MEREELIKMWLAAAPDHTRESYAAFAAVAPKIAFQVLQTWSEGRVWCPHCHAHYEVDACDGDGALVTYYGEDGPVECECRECEKTFFVQERVRRTYASGRTVEEAKE